MEPTNSLPHFPTTGWYLLGELELSSGTAVDSAIQTWFAERLSPLNLSPGFLSRVVQSAQESAMRSLHPQAGWPFGHIHLSIHAPRVYLVEGKTWGFFHIEKIENRAAGMDGHDHAIDFYLYVEGE